MAQKKKPATKSRSRSSRSVSSKGSVLSRLRDSMQRAPVVTLFIVLFGALGLYFLVNTYAMPAMRGVPANDAARGLNYNGLRRDPEGPCGPDGFKVEKANENADHACTHPDPGPKGVDLRERDKAIDKELTDLAAYDAKYMTAGEDGTIPEGAPAFEAANVNGGYSLSEIAGRAWPCIGTGTDGPRVRWLYVYKAGNTNRLGSLRDNFAAIARRVNAVVYNSSMASGNKPQKVRYATNADCSLRIAAVAITGDINNFGNIKTQLRNAGYNRSDRKYIVQVDAAGNCGLGDLYVSDTNSATNPNNGGNMFAASWRPCWNYAEPHELGHTLGAVQNTAPRSTGGFHCNDGNDVMCYDDGTARSNMTHPCPASIKNWMFDCGFNDYFDRGTENAYVSTHWNIAESQYLTR